MVARPERMEQDLKALGMLRELEQPHYANNGEELQVGRCSKRASQYQVDVECQGGSDVDDIDRRFEVLDLVRTRDEPESHRCTR